MTRKKLKPSKINGSSYIYGKDGLEKFFDVVNQSKMIEIISRTVKDGRVVSLINKYLKAGVVIDKRFEETDIGLAQDQLVKVNI